LIKYKKIQGNELNDWLNTIDNTLFVCGNDCNGEKEPRDGYLSNIIKNLNYNVAIMTRTKENIPHHFDIIINKTKIDDITWYSIKEYLNPLIGNDHIKNIILDITGMDLEILLYLLPIFQKKDLNIYCIYITPAEYSKENFPIETQEIQQPKGYNTFPKESIRNKGHLIILGFDELRAEKFIKEYDWNISNLYIVTGADSQDHSDRALSAAGPTINSMKNHKKHKKHIQLGNPNEIINFIKSLLNKYEFIDIVPLGPKSILLGIVLFYLSEKETLQEKIRLLYDFPISQEGRSKGIGELFLFDCTEMLK